MAITQGIPRPWQCFLLPAPLGLSRKPIIRQLMSVAACCLSQWADLTMCWLDWIYVYILYMYNMYIYIYICCFRFEVETRFIYLESIEASKSSKSRAAKFNSRPFAIFCNMLQGAICNMYQHLPPQQNTQTPKIITGWWFGTFFMTFHILGIVTPADS